MEISREPVSGLPPIRRPRPSVYDADVAAALAGEIRSTYAEDRREAGWIVKRLRRAGDRVGATVHVRTHAVTVDGQTKVKIIFTAEPREGITPCT